MEDSEERHEFYRSDCGSRSSHGNDHRQHKPNKKKKKKPKKKKKEDPKWAMRSPDSTISFNDSSIIDAEKLVPAIEQVEFQGFAVQE